MPLHTPDQIYNGSSRQRQRAAAIVFPRQGASVLANVAGATTARRRRPPPAAVVAALKGTPWYRRARRASFSFFIKVTAVRYHPVVGYRHRT